MQHIDPIYVGNDAIEALLAYCQQQNLSKFVLVADDNTYSALGQRVDDALRQQSYDVATVVLTGDEIIADERYLTRVLVEAPPEPRTYIAVGSGTLTDITRFVSHRTRNPFISLPTAPSVDGFTSVGAPLVLNGVKQTLICQAPVAVFADLPTLQSSPTRMIAAGFGDMLGKLTSLADWRLGALLWNEPYDEAVALRTRKALDSCIQNSEAIGVVDAEGIRVLMDGLIESGLSMMQFGRSHPASGAEHHCSHYWEMMLLQQNRPALLHGAKVGFATSQVAQLYQQIRDMPVDEVRRRIQNVTKPDRTQEVETIRRAYGSQAGVVIREQAAFLDLSDDKFEKLKRNVLDHWQDIQTIARDVPSHDEIVHLLRTVHAPASSEELGLSPEEVRNGHQYGHYLRNRFTVRKLFHLFGLD